MIPDSVACKLEKKRDKKKVKDKKKMTKKKLW